MNQQDKQMSNSTPAEIPVKRKRGRPRKDENLLKKNPNSPVTPASDSTRRNHHVEVPQNDCVDSDMVGQVVSGVIEGSFDAGYLLSVRAGNSGTLLRGVVFQQGLFTPITAANDIAPHAKMCKRGEFPIPVFNPQNQVNGSDPLLEHNVKQPLQSENQEPTAPDQVLPSELQSGTPSTLINQSAYVTVPLTNMPKNDLGASFGGKVTPQTNPDIQSAPSLENLRMVEQDEVMQVFEVSTQLEGPKIDAEAAKNVISESASEPRVNILPGNKTINQVPQVHNRAVKSGVKPSELVHNELKSPNLKLHLSPVVAKPQPVPPEYQSTESGFEPSELVHNELKNPITELHETPVVAKPQSMLPEPSSEPIDIVMESLNSSKNDMPQEKQSELAEKFLRKVQTSQNGIPVSDAAQNTEEGLQPDPRTEEATPSTNMLAAEEFVLPVRLEPQILGSAGCTAGMGFVLEDVIPPTQSYYHPNVSGNF